MFLSRISGLSLATKPNKLHFIRLFSKTPLYAFKDKGDEEFENPILRTLRVLSSDITNAYNVVTGGPVAPRNPTHTDVLIIGGGGIGSSIAYWLKEKSNADSFDVLVVEKDPTVSIELLQLSQFSSHQYCRICFVSVCN